VFSIRVYVSLRYNLLTSLNPFFSSLMSYFLWNETCLRPPPFLFLFAKFVRDLVDLDGSER